MSVQFGVLARLTWWEYSWDIMEPVTYFVTYGTAIIAYSYFVLTKQEYMYNDVGMYIFHCTGIGLYTAPKNNNLTPPPEVLTTLLYTY